MRRIYLDHSATTGVRKEVLDEMLPYFSEVYGNGSSQHSFGRDAMKAIDEARRKVAKAINAKPNEIYFTSGGTESDNWAIKGAIYANLERGKHIITSAIEHPAVMDSIKCLEKELGIEVTYLKVDGEGIISLEELERAIRPDTVLISVMAANNEMGAIEPIEEIGRIARARGIYFHTDAVQAIGAVDIDVEKMNIDMLSLSAHKFYGPKGVGVLYRRNGIRVKKFMNGGEQERNQRASTLNTSGIVGLGKAIELASENIDKNNEYLASLRDSFVEKLISRVDNIRFNGPKDMTKRLANNANFSFEFIEGESLLLRLDLDGIAVSSGSACSSAALEASYVLLATGVPIDIAHGSIRFSFGLENTMEDVDYTVDKVEKIVGDLRAMSPLFKRIDGGEFNV